MQKKLLLLCCAVLSLSACTKTTQPANAGVSPYIQCRSLKRQQLFLRMHSANRDHFQIQSESQRLGEAYHKMNCDKIIHAQKSGAKKTPKKSSKNRFNITEKVIKK